jgi:hypothetical protein
MCIDTSKKTLIILPHLDDEFALVPLIKKIFKLSSNYPKIIFCAERMLDPKEKRNNRRYESIASLDLLGCHKKNITYLNDIFVVQDLKLISSSKKIYNFVRDLYLNGDFNQIITLGFEGGHPDHDSLALIVSKVSTDHNISVFYVPAYNYRKTLFIPISVFRPLRSQKKFFVKEQFGIFCWKECLKIAYIYKTERKAFIKLLPFLLVQSIFSKTIYLSKTIEIDTVDWDKSLSQKIYKTSKNEVLQALKC